MDLNILKADVKHIDDLRGEIEYREEIIAEKCHEIGQQVLIHLRILRKVFGKFRPPSLRPLLNADIRESSYISDLTIREENLSFQDPDGDWFDFPLKYLGENYEQEIQAEYDAVVAPMERKAAKAAEEKEKAELARLIAKYCPD